MVPRAHPDAALSDVELKSLFQRLRDERGVVAEQIEALERDLEARADCAIRDVADAAAFLESNERAATLLRQRRQGLDEIEAALGRMKSGAYGVSETTGEPIALKRLQTMPWARQGVDPGPSE